MGGQGRNANEILGAVVVFPALAVFAIGMLVAGWIRALWMAP